MLWRKSPATCFCYQTNFLHFFHYCFFASRNTQLISFTYMVSELHAGIFLQLLKVLKRLSNDAISSKFRDSSESDDPSEHQRLRSSIFKKIQSTKIMIFYYLWYLFLFYFIDIAYVSMLSVNCDRYICLFCRLTRRRSRLILPFRDIFRFFYLISRNTVFQAKPKMSADWCLKEL